MKEIFGETHISLFSVQKINYFHVIQRTLGFLSLDFELHECVLFLFVFLNGASLNCVNVTDPFYNSRISEQQLLLLLSWFCVGS